MDPSSHRLPTAHLAKLTSSRVLSVRYRLAPQNPFPNALLDGLTAYLSLLSPPLSSLHNPVPASKIVFAGDSAGGNLSLSLLLTLLTLQRKGIQSIRFHGQDVPLSLPAGLALNSPWCDISRALPSCTTNANYDYMNPPADFGFAEDPPADDVWPAAPPRVDLYVNASALIHPLVSPLAARAEDWSGAPPVYMCAGNEGLEDEIAVTARRMWEAGVDVVFDGFEGMPHCFGMIFPHGPMGRECMGTWGRFIKEAVEGGVEKRSAKATWAKAFSNPVERVEVEWGELKKELSDQEVERLLRGKKDRYMEKEERMVREWRKKQQDQPKPKL
jgi:acetyl esterase/lipase